MKQVINEIPDYSFYEYNELKEELDSLNKSMIELSLQFAEIEKELYYQSCIYLMLCLQEVERLIAEKEMNVQ